MTMMQETPAAHEDYLIEALFKEARQRRRRRWIGWLLVLALGGGGLALGFGGRGSGTVSPSTNQQPGGGNYQALETPSKQTTTAMLDYFLPTSGATFAVGFQFRDAVAAVESQDVSRCITSKGFAAPPTWSPLPYSGDNTEFPYLSYVGASGFGVAPGFSDGPTAGPTNETSQAQAAALNAATKTCRTSTLAVFDPVLLSGSTLQEPWMTQIVPSIDNGAPFQQALIGWRSCMHDAGINVTTIDSFFTYADTQSHLGSTLGIAATYARCLAPAEAIRDNLRQQARTAFLSANAPAVAQLVHDVNGLLVQASR